MGLLDALTDKQFWQDIGSNATDLAQGASNSQAGMVSGPVDVLAWLLRKAGVPVPSNPLGGSDWMAQQGLTAQPKNHLLGLLGEGVGGVAPMVAAAKAPQIANGLLNMGENLAAPRTMNPQTGAIVWHGSPHKFDKFDASKIGTGEGAQAYGHGVYFADSPNVAEAYANKLTKVDGQAISDQLDSRVRYLNMLKQQAASGDTNAVKNIPIIEKSIAELKNNGSLYKVDLPDEHIAKMLDWDAPLNQQAPEVRDILQKQMGSAWDAFNHKTGGDYLQYGLGVGHNVELSNAGIPGVKYLDGGSRGAGTGTRNYVVFPGNEGLLNILERNGQPLK